MGASGQRNFSITSCTDDQQIRSFCDEVREQLVYEQRSDLIRIWVLGRIRHRPPQMDGFLSVTRYVDTQDLDGQISAKFLIDSSGI